MNIDGGLFRSLVVLGFLLIGPGAAYVPLLRLSNPSYTIILSVALSLTLALLVGAVAVYGGFWSPPLIMNILVGLTFAGLLCQVLLANREANQARSAANPPPHETDQADQTNQTDGYALAWSQGEPQIEQ